MYILWIKGIGSDKNNNYMKLTLLVLALSLLGVALGGRILNG